MKKLNNLITISLIIIIIISLILFFSMKANKKNSGINAQIKEKQVEKKIITNDYVIEVINKFIDEIIFMGYQNPKSEKYVEKSFNEVTYNIFNLSIKDKIYYVLNMMNENEIKIEDLNKKYREYFMEDELIYENINYCNTFLYDQNKNIYSKVEECLKNSFDLLMIYKDNYVKDESKVYVDLYVGVKNDSVFSDFTKEKKLDFLAKDFKINDDNKRYFSKYVITLSEDEDGLYLLEKIEKNGKDSNNI